MLAQTEEELEQRAGRLQALLGSGTIEPTDAFAGGGSLPEERIVSRALVLQPRMPVDQAAALLRSGDPAVIGRIQQDRLLIDMVAVSDEDLPELAEALRGILA
jgi:L-seryl-tRNA(Ser) seleniumtransferase